MNILRIAGGLLAIVLLCFLLPFLYFLYEKLDGELMQTHCPLLTPDKNGRVWVKVKKE